MKEEALKLADELEKPVSVPNQHDMIYIDGHRMYGAQMIRRLVEELDKLEKDLHMTERHYERLCTEQSEPEKFWSNTPSFSDQFKQCEPVAWMAEHFDGRKRIEIAGNVYDQDAGWGHKRIPLYTTPQTKPLSDEEIGDCVDDCFGLMALQHKYTYSIDQVQEYGLKLSRAIEERHGIK